MSEESRKKRPESKGLGKGDIEPPKAFQFKAGQSGNPGGRAKVPDTLKKRLRDITPEVVQFWYDTLKDPEAKLNERIKVSELIFERAYGKTPQSVDVNASVEQTKVDLSGVPEDQLGVLLTAVTSILAPEE